MNLYVPLHCHSYYSLLDGLPSPMDIAERCKELGLPAVALTDHGNLFGMKAFHDATKKVGLKPIIGCELYICEDDASKQEAANNRRHHLTVLARNEEGVHDLVRLVSETNRPDYFYRRPRIDLKNLAPFSRGNIICLSGCLAGQLSSCLFTDFREACSVSAKTDSAKQVQKLLRPDWMEVAGKVVESYRAIFGKENYWIELQSEGMPVQDVVVACLRTLGKHMGVRSVATLDSHYCRAGDAQDQRILLYGQLHTTQEAQEVAKNMGGDTMHFFHADTFYIYSPEEMAATYTGEEIEASMEIGDMVGRCTLGRKPCLPKFTNPEMTSAKVDADTYLKRLVNAGARRKLGHLSEAEKEPYRKQIRHELAVIREAKLADYLLIVWDFCKFIDDNNGPRGKGRGSGAGCLVNYALNITDIDPIKTGLYFERFYSSSRNMPPFFKGTDFDTWYSREFNNLIHTTPDEDRALIIDIAKRASERPHNEALLDAEIAWIDENNPRLWQWFKTQQPGANPGNSHVLYAITMTDQLVQDQPAILVDAHTSLPDIDTDVGVRFRSRVIQYLMERWGHDRVSQMVTFGRLQGRAALKEVFKAQADTVKHLMRVKATKEGKDPDAISIRPFDVCNEITSFIPAEPEIADELQVIRVERGDDRYGILKWAVEHVEQVAKAYEDYKPLFDQAMRIEGTKKSQSKHAAGVVIADRPIAELVPMVFDPSTRQRICGIEMASAEAMGGVKFDVLGVAALDKLWLIQQLVNDHTKAALELEADYVEEEED